VVTLLKDIRAAVERLWPYSGVESWDAVGLVCGNPCAEVKSVMLAIDAVKATVAEAIERDTDLLIVHHPLFLRGTTSVAEDGYKGALIAGLIRGDCGLLTVHTNADVVNEGVSDVIAHRLGVVDARPIVSGVDSTVGLGRVGDLYRPVTLGRLAMQLAELLPPTASGIRVAGEYDALVKRVALCGGAGDSLLSDPAVVTADVYITSDLRHHPVSEAREQAIIGSGQPALIDVSHWASEFLWLETAAKKLGDMFPNVCIDVSDCRTDPWDFVVTQ
jgi:dinuclear metal center YbgI/SA1388 family protein